jgi:hypothetical protein
MSFAILVAGVAAEEKEEKEKLSRCILDLVKKGFRFLTCGATFSFILRFHHALRVRVQI